MLKGNVSVCDCCDARAVDGDVFFQFVMPRIAARSTPNVPAQLLACPACKPKIEFAMKMRSPQSLPPGRLRKALETIRTKDTLKMLHIY